MITSIRKIFAAIGQKITSPQKRCPWVSHYPEGVEWDVEIPVRPLYDLLLDAHSRYPNNIAIDFLGKTYTYRELMQSVSAMAAGLQAQGLQKGMRVGLFMPNSPHFVISYYAVLMAGGTVVNFNPLYPVHDVVHQVKDAGVEMMVTFAMKPLLGKLVQCRQEADIPKLVVARFDEALPFPKNWLFPLLKRKQVMPLPSGEGYVAFADLLKTNPDTLKEVDIHPEEDVAVLQYTGGTTGLPKGTMLTHANLYANAVQCGMWFAGMEEGNERMMGVLPCFHVFAMTVVMNLSVHMGLQMILHPQFELEEVLKDIAKKKPTLLIGVPTIFSAINQCKQLDNYDLTSLKFCISGGAGLPLDVKRKFEELTGCKLVEGYGLSESSPVVAANPFFGKNKAGSIGMPFPATVLEIVSNDGKGRLLSAGKTGEICIRGPQVMKGYWHNEEATAATLESGRLHTGDMGYMDEEGYFFVVDRLKEMIISGGYNIYPRNIEEVLYTHPDVAEAAVIGIDDDYWGQRVKAFVALKAGGDLDEARLIEFLRDKLPRFALPSEIEFRDALPKTMIGKISKKDLL